MTNYKQEEVSYAIMSLAQSAEGRDYRFLYSASPKGELIVRTLQKQGAFSSRNWVEVSEPIVIDENGVMRSDNHNLVGVVQRQLDYIRASKAVMFDRANNSR